MRFGAPRSGRSIEATAEELREELSVGRMPLGLASGFRRKVASVA
jgi:hypothetical protein